MSKCTLHRIIRLAVLTFILITAAPPLGASDRVARIGHFIFAAYPELPKEAFLTIEVHGRYDNDQDADFLVGVKVPVCCCAAVSPPAQAIAAPPLPPGMLPPSITAPQQPAAARLDPLQAHDADTAKKDPEPHCVASTIADLIERPIFGSSFQFEGKTGEVTEFVSGTHQQALEQVRRTIQGEINQTHRLWHDEEMLATLTAAGAKFGPGHCDEVARLLPTEALTALIGPFRIRKIQFNITNPYLKLYWELTLDVRRSDGSRREYVAAVEPFQGKLISLTRQKR